MTYSTADGIEFEVRIRYDNVVAFDGNGVQMGTFDDSTQINNRSGISTTGIGAAAGTGVSVNTNSVSISANR